MLYGIVFILAVLILWGCGFLVFWRVPVCRKAPRPLRRPPVSVIVPARNEAENLPGLLKSLQEQTLQPREILVVDDASTDRTAAIGREQGANVLTSRPLPDGWYGKPWACQQGADAAQGELLLFVDADTRFAFDGVERAVDTLVNSGGALSIIPYHRVIRLYEQLSLFFNLMMAIGVDAFSVRSRGHHCAGLFGPFLLVSRTDYARAGGHAAVKDRVLENFHLGQSFRALGIATRCFGGKGTVTMRMYPGGVKSLIDGWGKACASGAAGTSRPVLLLAVAWISGSLLAVLALIAAVAMTSSGSTVAAGLAVYALFVIQIRTMMSRLGSFRFFAALLYPLPLAFYLLVFCSAVLAQRRGRKAVWKGRAVR